MFYVYELIDSRDNKPFYVGKGSSDRCKHHVANALNWLRAGRPRTHYDGNVYKMRKILSILRNDGHVKHKIVHQVEDEDKAFRLEEKRINKLGLENLTNIFSSRAIGGRRKPVSAETRAKLSAATKKSMADPEARKRISDKLKGHIHSAATRKKLGKGSKAYWAKMSKRERSAKAKSRWTPESRAKMSESAKHRTGPHSGNSKLTLKQAKEIRVSIEPTRMLVTKYGVSSTTIKNIRAGRTWKDY